MGENIACSFKGKTVLITGSSSGIGAGAAVEFAKLGANLVLTGRNVKGLEETKKKCIKEGLKEKQIVLIAGDLVDDTFQKSLVDGAITNFGQLDILVNNAGMYLEQPIMELTIDGFDEIHNVNLKATVGLTLIALPHLVVSKGNVVNISSAGSLRPTLNSMSYCISKAEMDMFTKSMAFEMAPQGVRINSVNAGCVPTNIARHCNLGAPEDAGKRYKAVIDNHPLGRIGEIKEIADAIVFLSSEKATFVTGQILGVCGGLSLGGVKF